ncbi:MAG: hypothetical protein NT172_07635 [Planctomycetota bacterium]|nr:hypothetical protein [Planctomycetota bacterium]
MSRDSIWSPSLTETELKTVREEQAKLLARDPRFSIHAYRFVMQALRVATIKYHGALSAKSGSGKLPETPDHVSGQQLSYAAAEFATQEYGYLAYRVLSHWGIRTTGDIGDLVYNMIEENHMQRSPADNRADFDDVFDFKQVFEQEFRITLDED